jgi:hypothetical protein
MMVRRLVPLTLIAAFALAGSAHAATQREKYSPFDADGTLRAGLSVTRGVPGECTTGSYIVVDAYRCFAGNRIYSVCYLDERNPATPSLLCVASPWARSAVRLTFDEDPDGSYGAKPGGLPWALELSSGTRCVWVGGATTVVQGRRLNYGCFDGRVLFGSPDTTRSTWRIRAARDGDGRGMRKVAIRTAWR